MRSGVALAAASHTLLRELILPGDELSLDACHTLGRALARDNCALTSLDLTSSANERVGAGMDDHAVLALSDGLGANTSLRSLCLAHNRIGKEGAKALGQKLARQNRGLTLLDVRANRLVRPHGRYFEAQWPPPSTLRWTTTTA